MVSPPQSRDRTNFNEAVGFRQRKSFRHEHPDHGNVTSMRPSAFANGNSEELRILAGRAADFNEAVGFRQRKSPQHRSRRICGCTSMRPSAFANGNHGNCGR